MSYGILLLVLSLSTLVLGDVCISLNFITDKLSSSFLFSYHYFIVLKNIFVNTLDENENMFSQTRHKFLMSRLVFENKECDTFGEWSGRYEDNKGSTSKMFVDFSIKKPISEGTMVDVETL